MIYILNMSRFNVSIDSGEWGMDAQGEVPVVYRDLRVRLTEACFTSLTAAYTAILRSKHDSEPANEVLAESIPCIILSKLDI